MVLSSWLVRFKRTLLRPRLRGAAQHVLGPQRGEFGKSALSPHIEVFENKALLSAVTFSVNTLNDTVDANIGDGLAQDGAGNTSLRAAIQEANATTGVDEIIINLPADQSAYAFTLAGDDAVAAVGDLDITNTTVPITIRGAGASVTTISAANLDRIFHVFASADLTVTDVTLKDGNSTINNPLGDGGVVENSGTLTFVRTILSDSQADSGGAIINLAGDTTIIASTFSSNTSTTSGGAIYIADGTVNIDASTFSSNTTTGTSQGGGAIWIGGGGLSIARSTFESNAATGATGQGGAIFATGAAVTTQVSNSTFTLNSSNQSGGALYLNNNFTSITSTTISNNNSRLNASGIFINAGTATLQNTVVAKNQADADLLTGTGTFTSLGNNFIGNDTGAGGAFVNGDQVGNGAAPLDPLLGVLSDNGGPTQTLLPTAMSPLIDNGNVPFVSSTSPQTDQRGATRVVGNVDIGAVETGFDGFFVDTLNDTVDDNLGDGIAEDAAGDTSLRAAIQEASFQGNNRVVVVSPEIYTLTLAGAGEDNGATGDLDLNGDITVQGFGPRATVINANNLDRVAHVASGASVTLADLRLRNGSATNGGGLLNEGFAFVSNVSVVDNTASLSGGGIDSPGVLTLFSSAVRRNTAGASGGGISATGMATLQNTAVTNNTAMRAGGINVGLQLKIFNSEVSDNTATTGEAGGINVEPFATLNMSEGTTVFSNQAFSGAGGIGVLGTANISGSTIISNSVTNSGDGGGIEVSGTLSLTGSAVSGNDASNGGGISVRDGSTVEIEFSTVEGNTASSSGGGINSLGSLSVQNSTLSNNTATNGSGGGLSTAAGVGTVGSAALSNVTVSSNTANDGGGIAATGQSVDIRNATITLNSSVTGGGLSGSAGSTVSVINSIIAANTTTGSDPDVAGTVFTGGNNVIGIAGGPFTDGVNGDQVGSVGTPLDPKLGVLVDNEGGLDTHALLAGSPAIDTGNNAAVATVTTDQRGATRIINGTVDVGAFESGFTGFFVNTTNDTVDDNPGDGNALDALGNTSFRAAIMEANATMGSDVIVLPGGSYGITLAGRGEDGAATGDLDITDDLVIQGYGSNATTIDGRDLDRIFDVKANNTVTINDLAVINGRVIDPSDDVGGGLRNIDSTVNLNRIDFRNNSAGFAGGAISTEDTSGGEESFATLNLVGSRIGDNTAVFGAGVYTEADTLNVSGTLFINNNATSAGGAIFISNAVTSITDSQISQNTASSQGGGVYVESFGGETTTITTSVIEGNQAIEGGGGGVYSKATVNIISSDIVKNSAQGQGGGGLYNDGIMTITDSRVSMNQADGFSLVEGAGIFNSSSGTLTITKSEVADNTLAAMAGGGGGISSQGTLIVDRSTILGNMAPEAAGVNSGGTTTVTNSTISGNQTLNTDGGGIASTGFGNTTTIINSTVTNNSSSQFGGGTSGDVTLKNSIVAGNTAATGDPDVTGAVTTQGNNLIGDVGSAIGISNGVLGDIVGGEAGSGGTLTLVIGGTPIEVISAAHGLSTGAIVRISGVIGVGTANGTFKITVVDADRFTLDGSTGTGTGNMGTFVVLIDPQLGALSDNATAPTGLPGAGNPMTIGIGIANVVPAVTTVPRTQALLTGSPAIDTGNNFGAPSIDQRGITRPVDGNNDMTATVDIGAVELFYTTVSGIKFEDANGNGIQDLGEVGLPGIVIYVDVNQNGEFDSGESSTLSNFDNPLTMGVDETGTYTLQLVPPGAVVIAEEIRMSTVPIPVPSRTTNPAAPMLGPTETVSTVADADDVITTDLDGDGNPDFVVVQPGASALSVQLNPMTPMASTFFLTTGTTPADVVAVDLTGDGLPELVVADFGAATVSVFTNLGGGNFSARVATAVQNDPESLAIGDFDGDGDQDVAVANSDSNSVSILHNTLGSLAVANTLPVGVNPTDIGAADFDRDGNIDIVTTDLGSNQLTVHFNEGGNTHTATTISLAGAGPDVLVVDDFDRDGFFDIAVGNVTTNQVVLLSGIGFRTFTAPTVLGAVSNLTDLEAVDLDSDGLPELLAASEGAASNVVVFANSITGFDSGTAFSSGANVQALGVGVVPTGRVVVITASAANGSIAILPNLSHSQFITTQTNVPLSGVNFGNQSLGTITGTKFHDRNGNLFQDMGEEGLPGVTIFVDTNGNNTHEPYEPSATTDANGFYAFSNIIPGEYQIVEEVPSGFTQTSPNSVNFDTQALDFIRDDAVDSVTLDFDDDGILDIVLLSQGVSNGQVDVFRGTGTNSFVLAATAIVGGTPTAIATADLDGDMDFDFVVTNGDNTLSIIENNAGVLVTGSPIAAGDSPSSVALADIDGDLDIDIAVGKSASAGGAASVAFYTNLGSLTFSAPTTVGTGGSVSSVTFADLDGDTDVELLATDFDQDEFAVLRNDGGVFSVAVQVATGLGPRDIIALEVDEFGGLDVVVATETDSSVFTHTSNGVLSFDVGVATSTGVASASLAVLDANDDSLQNLVVGSVAQGVSILTASNGLGFNPGVVVIADANAGGLSVGDFDRDGKPDIVVPDGTLLKSANVLYNRLGNNQVLVSGGGTSVADFGNIQFATVSGTKFEDLNENGIQDMGEVGLAGFTIFIDENESGSLEAGEPSAVTAADGTYTITDVDPLRTHRVLEVLTTSYRQTFPSASAIDLAVIVNTGEIALDLQLGDLDGNGGLDIVIANEGDNTVTVVLTNPNTSVISRIDYAAGGAAATLRLVDIDGDMALDIVTGNFTSNTVSVLLNNGSGVFGAATTTAAGQDADRIEIVDIDSNGVPDVVVTNAGQSQLTLLSNNGSGGLTRSGTVSVSVDPTDLVAGDFDNDGDTDLAVSTLGGNDVTVLLNQSGTFVASTPVSVTGGPVTIDVGDFDLDGNLDVAAATLTQVHRLFGNGNGTLQADVSPLSIGDLSEVLTVDFDADGDDDLIVNEFMAAQVLINDGAGNFSSNSLGNGTSLLEALAVGDLNQDNRVDLLAILSDSNRAALFMNSTGTEFVMPAAGQAVVGIDFGNRLFNVGPAITAPPTVVSTENVNFVFELTNAISFFDVDSGAASLETTLSVTNGVLTLGSTTNLVVNGNGSSTVTLTGTEADSNNGLDGLIFKPDADFFGLAKLSIEVNDLGNIGAGGEQRSQASTDITVLPVNNAPDIDNGQTATFAIDENSVNGTSVFNIAFSDVDSIPAELNFTLTSGNTDNVFVIDSAGNVTVNDFTKLDAESVTQYTLNVELRDTSTTAPTPLTDTMLFTVNVNNLNDNTPVITAAQSFAINENLANGSNVGTVVATDADAGTSFSDWTITGGNTGGAFSINSNTGLLEVANVTVLNREARDSFTLALTVSDGSNVSNPELVTINLNDVNEFPPTVDNGLTFALDENASASTVVGTVTGADQDATDTLQNWMITGGNTGGAFAINSVTGQIAVANSTPLDAETNPSFDLQITVSDGTNTSATQSVVVNLNDLNESDPVVVQEQAFFINENLGNGSTVGVVLAIDDDLTGTVQDFTIESGNTNGAFAINSATGEITVANQAALDAEVNETFDLMISVTDGENQSQTESVTVTLNDVNDNNPSVDAAQSFTINENLANGTAVGTLTATDLDITAMLSGWTIVSGNDNGAFSLDANTGVLTVNNSAALDREAQAGFTLMVTASDGTNTSAQEAVTVNLNDVNESPPVVDPGQSFAIPENSSAATSVGVATATDLDVTATLQNWMIVGGNTNNAFSINPATGEITVQTPGELNAEVATVFNLQISVSDGVNTSAAETVAINVTDVNESPPSVNLSQLFVIAENSANGTIVGNVLASDPDVSATLQSYTIARGNTNGAFAINAATGQLTVANVTALNTEVTPSFTLQITVSDGTNTSAQENVLVNVTDVNESAPTVDPGQNASINENLANGNTVLTLTASDADAASTFSNWTIVGGNVDLAFALDGTSGILTVNNSVALDRETRAGFTLMVTVSDGTNTSVSQAVTVNLNDVNESPPTVNAGQSLFIVENEPVNEVVGTVVGNDQDATGVLQNWMITGGNTGGAFSINPISGEIRVANQAVLDAEVNPTFSLSISVSDGELTSPAQSVEIFLNDVNDNNPSVDNGQTFNLNENSSNGTNVGTLTGFDADVTAMLSGWTIVGGNDNGAFALNAANGQLTVANQAALDREDRAGFTLMVTASDGVNTSTAEAVAVNLLDVNEFPPLVNPAQAFNVDENSAVGTNVGLVLGSDPDFSTALQNWTIVGGNTNNTFQINAASGLLQVNSMVLNAEVTPVFNLQVTVSDGMFTSMPQTVTVNLNDINEFTPGVVPGLTFAVNENSGNGTQIGPVIAFDNDLNPSLGNFTITAGNTGGAFAIDANTGVVSVANVAALDFEATPTFTLKVTVSDGSNNSVAEDVVVNLVDVNDNAPAIDLGLAFNVAENSPNNTAVGIATASDVDTNTTFSNRQIVGGNLDGAFSIDPTNGTITVANSAVLNFEASPVFILLVTVSDGLNTSPVGSIVINLNDVAEPFIVDNRALDPNGADITIKRTGGQLRAVDPLGVDLVPPAIFASVTNIILGTTASSDIVRIDFAGGDPIPIGGLTATNLDGPTDELIFGVNSSNAATDVFHSIFGGNSGSLTADGKMVNYQDFNLTDALPTATRSFELTPGGPNGLTLTDGSANDDFSLIEASDGSEILFLHPAILQLAGDSNDNTILLGTVDNQFDSVLNINGRSGSDTIDGSALMQADGSPVNFNALGGVGDDQIIDGLGADMIGGGAGNDVVEATLGDNVVDGGAGDDSVTTSVAGNQTVNGGTGSNTLTITNAIVGEVETTFNGTNAATVIGRIGMNQTTVSYTDFATVDDNIRSTDRTIFLENVAQTTQLIPGAIQSPGIGSYAFNDLTGRFVVVGGTNDDVIELLGIAPVFRSEISIQGGDGNDLVRLPGGLVRTGAGNSLDVFSEQIEIGDDVIVGGGGDLDLSGTTTITGDATLRAANISASNIQANGMTSVVFDGDATIDVINTTGPTQFGQDLNVTTSAVFGNATFNGDLDVAQTDFTGPVLLNGSNAILRGPTIVRDIVQGGAVSVDIEGDLQFLGGQLLTPTGVSIGVQEIDPPLVRVSGNGTVASSNTTVRAGGIISPGLSPGAIQTGNINFLPGSFFEVELNGPNAGMDYDQLIVVGSINLGGATLVPTIDFSPNQETFVIIDNDGVDSVTGTFANLPEGTGLTIPGVSPEVAIDYRYVITYQGGDGNDVVLVPEGSITGIVFDDDSDEDGTQGGEPVVPGVTVGLLKENGTVLATTTTNALGEYRFGDLLPRVNQQAYRIQITAANGKHFSQRDVGQDDSIDSDVNQLTGVSEPIAVGVGESISNVDAGLITTRIRILDAAPVQEGSSSLTTTVSFVVELNGRPPHVVTATAQAFEGNDGSGLPQATLGTNATLGHDFRQFVGGQQAIVFQPGQTSLVVSLSAFGDGFIEPTEVFEVRLDNPVQASILDGVARGTIINDDVATPTVVLPTVVLLSGAEVTEGRFPETSTLTFTVQLLGGAITDDITLNFTTEPVPVEEPPLGGATPNVDYTPITGQVTIEAGKTTASISVEITGDNDIEGDETVTLRLTDIQAVASGAVIGAIDEVTGLIINDDFATPTASIGDASVAESSSPNRPVLEFPVTLNGPAQTDVVITYRTLELSGNGTATAGEDFVPDADGQLTIRAGQTTGTIRVTTLGDSTIESDEVVAVELLNVPTGNANFEVTLAVGTIVNDDFLTPTLALGDGPTRAEGRVLQVSPLTFDVVLNGPAQADVVVFVSTLDLNEPGFATVNVDYQPLVNVQVLIPRGDVRASVDVNIIGDEFAETDENVRLQIVNVVSLGGINVDLDPTRTQVSGVIRNDDGEQPVVSIEPRTTVQELDAPFTSAAEFVILLDTFSPTEVTVDLDFVSPIMGMMPMMGAGLATPGVDFRDDGGSVTFAPGQTSASFFVIVNGDEDVEPPEDIFVRITGVTPNVTLDAFQDHGTATIIDNDNATPTVSIQSSVQIGELNDGRQTTASLEVSLDSAIDEDVTVFVSTPPENVPGYAMAGVDFIELINAPVVIPAGQMTANVSLVILGDNLDENTESFNVRIESVVNGLIAQGAREGSVTIIDNDAAAPVVVISDARVQEGDTDEDVDLIFIVSIEGPLNQDVSVEVETVRTENAPAGLAHSDGPVNGGVDDRDFFRTRRTLRFDPTVTVQEFRVRLRPDDAFEADELVFARLFNPIGVDLPTNNRQATGVIVNDDFDRPTLSISDATVREGDTDGESVLIFTVALDADPEPPTPAIPDVMVDFQTLDSSAIAGVDYTAVQGQLVFGEGERTKTIEVSVIGNLTDEAVKRLVVELSNPLEAELNNAAFQGEGTILNDDSSDVVLQIDSVTAFEGGEGSTSFDFTVTMIGRSPNPVTVDFSTESDTANAGDDFTATSGTLTFLPGGPITQTISVSVNADVNEDSEFESFLVNLSNPGNAIIDPVFIQGVGVIQDDDNRVPRVLGDAAFAEVRLERLKAAIDAGNEDEVIRIKRQLLNDAGLDAGLVLFADPVDVLLTDLDSRTTGYTDTAGEVTENARAYYSGDGVNELIIIPNADIGVYPLELSAVGSGEFRTAATLITAEGFAKTIINTSDLQVAELDFTATDLPIPAQSNVVAAAADAAAGRGQETAGEQLAGSVEAANAMAMLSAVNQSDANLSAAQIFGAAWGAVADTLNSIGDVVQNGLAPLLPGGDQSDAAGQEDSDEPTLDGFFKDFGKSLLGAPGAILNLDLFNQLPDSEDSEEADPKPNEAPSDEENADTKKRRNTREQTQNTEKMSAEEAQEKAQERRLRKEREAKVQTKVETRTKREIAKQKAAKAEEVRRVVFRRIDNQPTYKAPAFLEDLAKLTGQKLDQAAGKQPRQTQADAQQPSEPDQPES